MQLEQRQSRVTEKQIEREKLFSTSATSAAVQPTIRNNDLNR